MNPLFYFRIAPTLALSSVLFVPISQDQAETGVHHEAQAPLSVSQNIDGGAKLLLSNNTLYEIAPEDQMEASLWLTAPEVSVSSSENPDFPYLLKNHSTGKVVKARCG